MFAYLFVFSFVLVPFGSAGFSDVWERITGQVTSETVTQSITVTGGSAPVVYDVWNESMTDISSGPTEDSPTYIIINFSVSDSDGAANLDSATAFINFSLAGDSRAVSCTEYESSGNYAN